MRLLASNSGLYSRVASLAELCDDPDVVDDDLIRSDLVEVLNRLLNSPKALAVLEGRRHGVTRRRLGMAVDYLATAERFGTSASAAAINEVATAWGTNEGTIKSAVSTLRTQALAELEVLVSDVGSGSREERLVVVSHTIREFYVHYELG
jgi:hypothetical protein